MEITGKIIKVLPVREGTTERGNWMVATYVLETTGTRYPRHMVFEVSGKDRIERLNIVTLMGQPNDLTVFFDIDAREYKGNWYNTIRAYDVRPVVAAAHLTASPEASPEPFPPENVDKLPY